MSVLSEMETGPAEASSTPVLQSTTPRSSGGGGGGGIDREGSKGIPAGYLLPRPISGSWVPRRPGLGCGGVSGSSFGGSRLGWGETTVY